MLKTYIKWLYIILLMPLLASCSWEDLPAYEDANIEGAQFYFRWASDDKDAITGEPIVKEIQLNSSSKINQDAGTVDVTITVPAASNNFPESARQKCSLDQLWAQVTLSTDARLTPINGSKPLGTPDNWNQEHQYEVMAANGTKKIWTIRVVSFTK